MTEKKQVTLGGFFPPIWLLGIGSLGAVALCVFIGTGVLNIRDELAEHEKIQKELPAIRVAYADMRRQFEDINSQKDAFEKVLDGLKQREEEARQLLARRDSAKAELSETEKSLNRYREQQQIILKEKAQAGQEKLSMENEITRLRSERDALLSTVKKAQEKLADLQARTQTQQKLNELV